MIEKVEALAVVETRDDRTKSEFNDRMRTLSQNVSGKDYLNLPDKDRRSFQGNTLNTPNNEHNAGAYFTVK